MNQCSFLHINLLHHSFALKSLDTLFQLILQFICLSENKEALNTEDTAFGWQNVGAEWVIKGNKGWCMFPYTFLLHSFWVELIWWVMVPSYVSMYFHAYGFGCGLVWLISWYGSICETGCWSSPISFWNWLWLDCIAEYGFWFGELCMKF